MTRHAVRLADHSEEEVLGPDITVAERGGLVGSVLDCLGQRGTERRPDTVGVFRAVRARSGVAVKLGLNLPRRNVESSEYPDCDALRVRHQGAQQMPGG